MRGSIEICGNLHLATSLPKQGPESHFSSWWKSMYDTSTVPNMEGHKETTCSDFVPSVYPTSHEISESFTLSRALHLALQLLLGVALLLGLPRVRGGRQLDRRRSPGPGNPRNRPGWVRLMAQPPPRPVNSLQLRASGGDLLSVPFKLQPPPLGGCFCKKGQAHF